MVERQVVVGAVVIAVAIILSACIHAAASRYTILDKRGTVAAYVLDRWTGEFWLLRWEEAEPGRLVEQRK